MLAAERSWCDVPTMTTSDLSGFNWSPMRRNQDLTAAEHRARLSRAGATSKAFMATNTKFNCVGQMQHKVGQVEHLSSLSGQKVDHMCFTVKICRLIMLQVNF